MNLKKLLFLLVFFLLAASCRQEEESVQVIDQVLRIYVQDEAGNDLLDSKAEVSLYSVNLVDLDATTANVPVSAMKKLDSVKGYYYEYVSGAVRTLKSEDSEVQNYYSTMGIRFQDEAESEIDQDTLRIDYKLSPRLFSLEEVWLNQNLVFKKELNKQNELVIKREITVTN